MIRLPIRFFRCCAFLLLVVFVFLQIQPVLINKDFAVWGADFRRAEFDKLPPKSVSVLFVGSSRVMSGVDTMVLWEKYGIAAFNSAARAQTFATSHLWLEYALETQQPDIVVLGAYSITSPKNYCGFITGENNGRCNLDPYPFNMDKIEFIRRFIPTLSEKLTYYLPFFRYHTRWKFLSQYDFGSPELHPIFDQIYRGFFLEFETTPQNQIENYKDFSPVPIEDFDINYLEKCVELCASKNIPLAVSIFPFQSSVDDYGKMNTFCKLLQSKNIPYVNFMDPSILQEISLDFQTDLRDTSHLNVFGAQKVTTYLGDWLKEHYQLPDNRRNVIYSQWDEDYIRYEQMISDHFKEQPK